MNKTDIIEELTVIFRTAFEDSALVLNDEMSKEQVDSWDSLTFLTMIQMVEKRFDFRFKLLELGNMDTVGEICDMILNKLNTNE